MAFSRTYFLSLLKIGTPKFRRFIMNILPWKNLHTLRDIVDVIDSTAVEIFEEKKKALEEGDEAVTQQFGRGNDIMSILSAYYLSIYGIIVDVHIAYIVRANMSASAEERMSKEELLGQIS